MFPFSRGELGVIESETFDFSQLEEFINDDNENDIYFHDTLVTSSDLKLSEVQEKQHSSYIRSREQGLGAKEPVHLAGVSTEGRGHDQGGGVCATQSGIDPAQSTATTTTTPQLQKAYTVRNGRVSSVDVSSSFTKPHHLPDSPPDSGSEPPFSPPNEDPKLKCLSIDMLHHHQHPLHHPLSSAEMSVHLPEGLKHHYMNYSHLKHHVPPDVMISSSTSPTSSSSSPHPLRHQSPLSPVHSTHSASMPILHPNAGNPLNGPVLTQLPPSIMTSYLGNNMQQQLLSSQGAHLGHIYTGSEEFLYENLANPVSSTTSNKKRKLPESPKAQRSNTNGTNVQVKIEPSVPSPDPTTTMLPSSDEDYNLELNGVEANTLLVDSSFQCIRFQTFQQNPWAQLLDKDMKEIASPNFRVDADKGFNYSNADESFVCQKKNHFQVTVHIQPVAEAHYVRTAEGATRAIEKFSLHFQGVKMESPTQTIKVEQSQSDRSKRPFHPVPLEMITDQVTKTTVGRLHFSETTSNNMRKKGKPNPDQRFFFLVVSLCAHVAGDTPATVVAHASEKIIVRASNPGQFENDMELSWQKGHTLDSIFHNGRVGINTDRPEESLVVHGNIKVTGHILQPSDFRAKYDIHELDTREQLKNVSNLRIVRYRYLPNFSEKMGLNNSQVADTGVIAQQVQHILPDAVVQAGDVLLKDGQLIEKLLVVNKERIFMENVGAVKELCKVTDNLETRIDELERINKKLSSIKRKDSTKSTATDLSRMSSIASHAQHRCRRSCSKHVPGHKVTSCSSHFIQSSIVVLVVIMACCLMALATLYIMEWQSRSNIPYIRGAVLVQMKNSENATASTKSRIPDFFTIFPSSISSYPQSQSNSKKTTLTYDVLPKPDVKPSSKATIHDDSRFYGYHSGSIDCFSMECPIFCCEPDSELLTEDDALHFPLPDDDNLMRHHVEKKNGIHSSNSKKAESTFSSTATPKRGQPFSKEEAPHKLKRRMIEAEEEAAENNQLFRADYSSEPVLHLLELNATLLPELCTEERTDDSSVTFIFCSVYISRHFPHPNITLHFKTDETDTVIEFCGSRRSLSCTKEILRGDNSPSSNTITKREAVAQNHSWQLPVGSFIRSRYRFRMMSQRFSTDQQLCTLNANYRPFTEYVLTFQRRCDK